MTKSRTALFYVAALAAATLLLEGTLLRLLAVAQFYHFAFLVVSLALLGFGASGTLLSLSPRLLAVPLDRLLPNAGIAFAVSVFLSYAVINLLPFDSYSIAWERKQILYFVLYYLALTLPFLCGGVGIGAALASDSSESHHVYAANLVGSGCGALLAPLALWLAGVPGAVLISAAIGLLPALGGKRRLVISGIIALGLGGFVLLAGMNMRGMAPLGMSISPYKGLSYAQQYPGSRSVFGAWNAISRVDVMADAGTRQLPGLSYAYPDNPPPQLGMALDAGFIQPISLVGPKSFPAAAFMPESIAFALRPRANALVVEAGAGLGVLQALAGGASQITAVQENALARQAVAHTAGPVDIFAHPRVRSVIATERVFLKRDQSVYPLIFVPLIDAYQPVTSGAYSLAETYNLTVEAFVDLLAHLEAGGLLVITRWLQVPPSESIRLIATLIDALEESGVTEPREAIVAFRGIQTITTLVQPGGWTQEELDQVRTFADEKRYDLVWAPDIQLEEVNHHNRLSEPAYFVAARHLLTGNRQAFYDSYPYAVAPVRDDHPFFFHFFRWQQTPEVLATLGRTWQPFGGSGYFLLLAMLALVLLFSAILIIVPLAVFRQRHRGTSAQPRLSPMRVLLYFALLGLAFLFVEIPLIQRWILLLGHPTYAFTAVVLILLVFSSIGSLLARAPWLPRRTAFGALVILALLTPFFSTWLGSAVLGWPMLVRAAASGLALAPLALLMGLPFPFGLAWLESRAPGSVPWAWAINGCASVVAGVLAAILALSYGFALVLLLGAGMYAGAWVVLFVGGSAVDWTATS